MATNFYLSQYTKLILLILFPGGNLLLATAKEILRAEIPLTVLVNKNCTYPIPLSDSECKGSSLETRPSSGTIHPASQCPFLPPLITKWWTSQKSPSWCPSWQFTSSLFVMKEKFSSLTNRQLDLDCLSNTQNKTLVDTFKDFNTDNSTHTKGTHQKIKLPSMWITLIAKQCFLSHFVYILTWIFDQFWIYTKFTTNILHSKIFKLLGYCIENLNIRPKERNIPGQKL